MALKLYGSNLLEALSEQLHENLKQEHNDVFQPDYIINQTEGMRNWLLIQMAEKAGIAANIKFLSPNELILKVAQIIDDSKFNNLSSNILCWIIYSVLNEDEFIKRFPEVSSYYISDKDADAKRIALAGKIADLFDQYQIYRHDFIDEWNLEDALNDNLNWQEFLWIRVKQKSGQEFKDKAEQGKLIIKSLTEQTKQDLLRNKLPNIHLFGISITTPYHLEILTELGKYININFYLLNPAPITYWQDNVSEKYMMFLRRAKKVKKDDLIIGNALLTSWGKIIRDTYYLLFRNDEMLNSYTPIGEDDPEPDSLLHKIQNDIFHNLIITTDKDYARNVIEEKDLKDGSITLNSCFTIAREVEVLHNYLVHLVDNETERFSARDIVVMVSDIDSYSPFIKAVFENSPYKFKFTIADETLNTGDNLINALQALLSFTLDDFKGENVLSLLEYSFIKNRFSINNILLIRKLIDKANIRFGINGSLSDESIYLSWKYGIQKIIYSICISGDEEYYFENDGYYLVDLVEGEDSFEAIRFFYFVNKLIESVEERNISRPLNEWVNFTEEIIEGFLWNIDDPVSDDYEILINKLQSFNVAQQFLNETIKYDVFLKVFFDHISTETRNSAFANGGITFCSLIPMRSIPFEIVALLGLNFDKFPRKENSLSFNLLNAEKRKGDRNTKDNDKHLFLETILSAKEYLYLSYIGQSVKDNAIFPPSVLIDELIDYIDEGIGKKADNKVFANCMIVKHPLHSYSTRYGNEEGLYNYLQFNSGKVIDIFKDEKFEEEVIKNIDIETLIKFFKNPFQFYYKNVLQIEYDDHDNLLPETEIFSLNNLELWQLKTSLLKRYKVVEGEAEREWKMKGLLPLKNSGKIAYDDISNSVKTVYEKFKEITQGCEEKIVSIDLKIDDVTISGTIENVYDGTLINTIFSKKLKTKHLLESYLKYLIGCASGEIQNLTIINCEGVLLKLKPLTKDESVEKLSKILEIFKEGQRTIIPFSPDWVEAGGKLPVDREKFLKTINKVTSEQFNTPDIYIKKENENGFFNDEIIFLKYSEYANILVSPLKDLFGLEEIKKEDNE